jgi:hypothetical protein
LNRALQHRRLSSHQHCATHHDDENHQGLRSRSVEPQQQVPLEHRRLLKLLIVRC